MTLSDRVAVMLDGQLLQVARPQDIYADSADRRVAEFVGSPKINMLKATARDRGHIEIAGMMVALPVEQPAGTAVTLGIRPEAFQLATRDRPGIFRGRIRLIEHLGSDLFVHLDIAGEEEPLIARLPVEHLSDANPGDLLELSVPSERLLVFDEAGKRLRLGSNVVSVREFVR
jgi:multiple sugar transport system ATP-binding protein